MQLLVPFDQLHVGVCIAILASMQAGIICSDIPSKYTVAFTDSIFSFRDF